MYVGPQFPLTLFSVYYMLRRIRAVYANAYLGSLNNRKAIQAQMLHRSHGSGENSYHLGDLRSQHPIPTTVVHIKRQTEAKKDSLSLRFEHEHASEEGAQTFSKGV
jgi:hypothetical protein